MSIAICDVDRCGQKNKDKRQKTKDSITMCDMSIHDKRPLLPLVRKRGTAKETMCFYVFYVV